MNKSLRLLSLLAALLVSGFGWADNGTYSGSVEQACKNDYSTDAITFSLSEMAGFFGVEASQFATDLQAFITADKAAYKVDDNSDKTLYVRQTVNGGESIYPNAEQGYSANLGDYFCGFWMDKDGKPLSYGENAAWYWLIQVDEEADEVQFLIGQMPDYWIEGGNPSCDLNIVYNGKTAFINLSAVIAAKPTVEATDKFSELEIVGSAEILMHQTQGAGGVAVEFVTSDMAEKLGISKDNLEETFEARLFARYYDFSNDMWTDSLTNRSTAGGSGFWTAPTQNPETGNDSPECAPHAWGDICKFYVEHLAYNAASDSIVGLSGQFGTNCAVNQEYYTTFYVVAGTKAYALKFILHIDEAEKIDFSDMEMVGSEEVIVAIDADETGATTIQVDLEKIGAMIGKTADELDAAGMNSLQSEGSLVNGLTAHTANNNGFWYNNEGYVCSYGDASAAMYIEPVSASTLSSLNVGKYVKTMIPEGGSCTSSVFFLGNTSYYRLDVTLKINKEDVIEGDSVPQSDWTLVDTQRFSVQVIRSENYSQKENTQLNWDGVLNALETTKVGKNDLYTWREYQSSWVPESLTNDYTCTPYPGFWMSEDGKTPTNWQPSCSYGMTLNVSSGVVTWYVHDATTHDTGESFEGEFFIVNWLNGKVVKIVCDVEYVAERVTVENAGEEDITIALTPDNMNSDGLYFTNIDMTKACEALGIDISEIESASWYVLNNSGSFTAVESFEGEDCMFDSMGSFANADSEDAQFAIGYDYEDNKFVASLLGNDPTAETLYSTRIALRSGNKRYIFNVTIGSEEALSIDNVKTSSKSYQLFDLSGRAVKNPTKGLYIVNGTKMLVK